MAKTVAKPTKGKSRDASQHSRAAKRGASPPPKNMFVKAPVEESDYQPWLHNASNAGINKKSKKKQLTRQQKMRRDRGIAKADENIDKLEKKVADSKAREKKVQSRRVEWEELNDRLEGKEKEKHREKEKEKVKTMSTTAGRRELDEGMKDVADVPSHEGKSATEQIQATENGVDAIQTTPMQSYEASKDDLDHVT